MSLDFQQVRQQVIEMGEKAPIREQYMRDLRHKALDTLENCADELAPLRAKVEAAVSQNPNLRCAVPRDEPLDTRTPLPPLPETVTLLAADGSQINPDRHGAVDYCLVNVGAIQMRRGSPESPSTTIRSHLLYDEQMYTSAGRITERMVALRRDLRERLLLAELAAGAQPPIITLTDGPLELWVGRESESEAKEYQKYFKEYLRALRELKAADASVAGYIDKPRGDLLVRLLEIASLPDDELEKAGREYRPLRGITDADLFREILPPGERSAVFGIQSRNAGKYEAELALQFFYLNVGRDEDHPYPVRVEIPAWVADNLQMLDDLHAVLVHQCQILGTRAYPYLLHRSHEIALVTLDEKTQVESMIALELRRRGGAVSQISQKQAAKDAGGRQRYGR
ncbi:MAG: DNA double-strand break repair nuclease NurA [Chloroflexi bacterium]|nr:DNA double-strand break repair nuclease NurA [Chloroflexota bacterium]